MRPVNLIPAEERRGQHAPLRSGALVYVLLGALVAVLVGVTALVLTGNQISDRESEVARLQVEDAEAIAKVERLAAYTQFRDLSQQRVATVASLAESRFDWERVMRELALILPDDAWLVSLTATATPTVSVGEGGGEGGGGTGLRAATPGPALELSGCADGQEAVAGFVTALKDIEGVTRVGVQSSELSDEEGSGEGGGAKGGDDCRTRDFIAKFELVVAFDAAPIPTVGGGEVPVTPPAESEATETSEEGG
jgi:Tfp pilus assembly protein PilN